MLDTEKIKFEDGKIEGLTEQLESAKESYDYLFAKDGKGLSNVTTKHSGGGNRVTKESIMGIKDASERIKAIQKNKHLFK